jgi:hypothetical protein
MIRRGIVNQEDAAVVIEHVQPRMRRIWLELIS